MNKKAQMFAVKGFSLLIVFFVLTIATFVTIEPFKETLDDVRSGSNLNCVGTLTHNTTSFSEQDDFEQLVKRPTCFVTGITMVYFIFSFLIASVAWVAVNWSKK